MRRKTIGLQFLHTIPRRVTFIHDDQINLNMHKNVFRNLYVDTTSETWFPNKHIKAEIKKQLDKKEDKLQVMEWKMRLDITLILSITIPYG